MDTFKNDCVVSTCATQGKFLENCLPTITSPEIYSHFSNITRNYISLWGNKGRICLHMCTYKKKTLKIKKGKNIKNIKRGRNGMPKSMQTRDEIIIVKVKSLIPASFFTPVCNCNVNRCREWALKIYIHYYIIPTLFACFLACHPYIFLYIFKCFLNLVLYFFDVNLSYS